MGKKILPSVLISIVKIFKNFIKTIITYFDDTYEKLIFNILLIAVFSGIYKLINRFDENAFSEKLDGINSIYFSAINSFTIGYGDILPQSNIAKIAVIIHSLIFWIIAIA